MAILAKMLENVGTCKHFFNSDGDIPERIEATATILPIPCSFDGIRLSYRNYLVKDAVGSIVIVHGFTEYCEKYTELVWYFMNAGYNVFTYDHRGHGFSDRQVEGYELAHVNRFEDYVSDLEHFVNNVVIPKGGKENINIFINS